MLVCFAVRRVLVCFGCPYGGGMFWLFVGWWYVLAVRRVVLLFVKFNLHMFVEREIPMLTTFFPIGLRFPKNSKKLKWKFTSTILKGHSLCKCCTALWKKLNHKTFCAVKYFIYNKHSATL